MPHTQKNLEKRHRIKQNPKRKGETGCAWSGGRTDRSCVYGGEGAGAGQACGFVQVFMPTIDSGTYASGGDRPGEALSLNTFHLISLYSGGMLLWA